MPTDLLDHVLIEVTRIAEHATGDIVGMLESSERFVDHRQLRSLLELCLAVLRGEVDVLNPAVVSGGEVLGHMRLELDDVVIWDLFHVRRRDDGGCVVVNGVD